MKPCRAGREFPVVCVGGSAGGLDAYMRLLKQLPNDMGVAIVIVNHVRTFATQLHEVLPRFTTMPGAGPMSSRSSCARLRSTGTAS
jgi:two-component system, chemotaxis family, protein-glutamate methylesterase/glutaminase